MMVEAQVENKVGKEESSGWVVVLVAAVVEVPRENEVG